MGTRPPARPPPSVNHHHANNSNNSNNNAPAIPLKALPRVPGDDINIWEESSSNHVMYPSYTPLLYLSLLQCLLLFTLTGERFDANNKLQAGTLNKLVERLTSETAPDLEFMKAFLMTYLLPYYTLIISYLYMVKKMK